MAVARTPNIGANFGRTTRLPHRGLGVLRVGRTILIMKNRPDLFASTLGKNGAGALLIRLTAIAKYYYRVSGPVLARSDEHTTLRK